MPSQDVRTVNCAKETSLMKLLGWQRWFRYLFFFSCFSTSCYNTMGINGQTKHLGNVDASHRWCNWGGGGGIITLSFNGTKKQLEHEHLK